eukprot:10954-Heterococcus_DN1.PRE.1
MPMCSAKMRATRYTLYNAVRDSGDMHTCMHAVQYLAMLHMLWLLLQGRGRPSLLSVASSEYYQHSLHSSLVHAMQSIP